MENCPYCKKQIDSLILTCPYCRKDGGFLPLIPGQMPQQYIHSEYIKFKDEIAPEFSGYEKWAHSLGKSIKIKASSKDEAKLKKAIDTAHLDIEPSQALSLSIMSFISVFFFGLILSVGVALAKGSIEEFPALLFILFVRPICHI